MFARVHTLETTPEQYARGLELVRDELLPFVRDATGFRGVIGLVDAAHRTSVLVTLWADREALARSADSGDRLSRLAADVSGATRRSLEDFEVAVLDLPGSSGAV